MPTHTTPRDHAIVIGASMAGLLAARVLSDHFRQVTLIERDLLPAGAEHRRGVPQARHTHGLLASGRDVLEKLFPGFSQALIARGALTSDVVRESRWFFEGGLHARAASDLNGLLVSRPTLEAAVRERVLAIPNIVRRDNITVEGLEFRDSAVAGVRAGSESIAASLTVDATGRGSKTPQWLAKLGYEKPAEEVVQIALGYATRYFRRRPGDLDGDKAAVIPPTPDEKRGGVILSQEDDRWVVTLVGHFDRYPPEQLPGFLEFARTLPAPFIYDVIRNAEPIGEPASARFPASIRRRYDRLRRFPGGYVVMGDAICSFNPVYGQGMSVACLEAIELDKTLRESGSDVARRFFARAAKVVDIPWSIAVGNDLRMKEAVGPRTAAVRFINWYMSKVHKAAHTDPVPALAFHKVANLLAPPPSIMAPRIALRVLRANLRRNTPVEVEDRAGAVAGV